MVERFKERPGTDLIDIDVNIYCERESHKGMVIGKGGAMLKKLPVLPVQTAKSFGLPRQSAVLGKGKIRLAR